MKLPQRTLWLSILFAVELALSIFPPGARAQFNKLQLGTPLPQVTVTPTPTPTAPPPPFARPHPRQPIPLPWKIAIVGSALVVSLTVLRWASRAWHKWNLFDRQYRFPPAVNIRPRLGGTRSGGTMATLDFRRDSTGEDA